MKLQGFDIELYEKPKNVAYFVDGTFEIYFDNFTLQKNCTEEYAKEICGQMGVKWE